MKRDNHGKTRVLGEGRYLRLLEDNGWEYAQRHAANGVVVLVAFNPTGQLVLVEQYRPAVHCRVVELPAGLVGDDAAPGESMVAAARRELHEETGYDAGSFQLLMEGPPAVGMSCEIVTFFQAKDLHRIGPGGGDASESIVVHEVALSDLRSWLATKQSEGCLVDPKIFTGLYLADVPGPGPAPGQNSSG